MKSRDHRSTAVLCVYVGAGIAFAFVRLLLGEGSLVTVVAYAGLLLVIAALWKTERPGLLLIRDWLPLLALPLLYAAIPATALSIGPFDSVVQQADRSIFGSDVAHGFGGAATGRAANEVLHAAYLSYYLIIYLPPLLMYRRGAFQQFQRTVLAFTVAMTLCFAMFWVFPVEGPRYLWTAPPGIFEGFFRRVALTILERGSSRGTAFPSSHQAIALAMALSCMRWNRQIGSVVLAAAILLGFGAVYGGFHYGADMIAGGLVGLGACVISWRSRPWQGASG